MKFNKLSASDLRIIADSINRLGRFDRDEVSRNMNLVLLESIEKEVESILNETPGKVLSSLLTELAEEKESLFEAKHDSIELVWSGPESPGLYNRDTMVVVEELFKNAKKSVYLSGYNFYDGLEIFKPLYSNLEKNSDLKIKMFFNINKKHDHENPKETLDRFKTSFKRYNWGTDKLPDFYFDPRSLDSNREGKAVLHAKTIIVDEEICFVTSANFTGKAQKENIEAGTLVKNSSFAKKLKKHFDGIVETGILEKLDF